MLLPRHGALRSNYNGARAGMRGLALAHRASLVAFRPPMACRPLRMSVRRAAVHPETRSGQRREDGGLRSSDGAPATGISFSVLREARQSRQPVRFNRRSLVRCELHRRKSVRRAAVHAETRSGQRRKHRRRLVGDGAPATGSLVLWEIVYRAQWRPRSRPPFALRGRYRGDSRAVVALRGLLQSQLFRRGGPCRRQLASGAGARLQGAAAALAHRGTGQENAPSTRVRKSAMRKTVYSKTTL